MTPREAIRKALTDRHVWDNDEQVEEYVDLFIKDLGECGYELAKRESVAEEYVRTLLVDGDAAAQEFLRRKP